MYHLISGILFRCNYHSVLLRCLEKADIEKLLKETHKGLARGQFGGETTAHKFLRARYYWPTLFKYVYAHAQKCQSC